MTAYAAPEDDQNGVTSLNGDALTVDDGASPSDTTIETGSVSETTSILAGGIDDTSGTTGLSGNNTASNGSVENVVGIQTVESVQNISNTAQDMTVGGASGASFALNGTDFPWPPNKFPSSGSIDSTDWHTPHYISSTDNPAYFGRTALRGSLPNAVNGIMQLDLDTYDSDPNDPHKDGSKDSLYGTSAISGPSQDDPLFFNPKTDGPLAFTVVAKYEPGSLQNNFSGSTIQKGIIGGWLYLYSDGGNPDVHDELDFEGMSNNPTQIQTNIYHNEPAGNGHPISYDFPNGASDLATYHTYTIEWYTNKVVWLVDGHEVREAKPTGTDPDPNHPGQWLDLVPTQNMALHSTIWAGLPDWPTGSDTLVVAQTPADDQTYRIDVQSLTVSKIPLQTAAAIQNDDLGITRTALPLDQATSIADSVNAGTETVTQFIDSLLSQITDTTLPAVAVEASMYNAVGSSAEITTLVTQFLPPQIDNATQLGLNPQVYASEALGLAFAFADENGGHGFANSFGPSNAFTPATPAGDAVFAAEAAAAIFGAAETGTTAQAILGWVTNWEAFYTAHGIPGVANATAAQIDLAARGAAWGDAVGVALTNNLGPLPGQVTKFLDDAAQGIATYSASLASQPTPAPFDVIPGTPPTGSAASLQLIGVPATASDPLAAHHT